MSRSVGVLRLGRTVAVFIAVIAVLSTDSAPSDAAPSGGTKLWVKHYDPTRGANETAAATAASPDGSKVFVAGTSDGDYATVAYDAATGTQLWATLHDFVDHSDDQATAVAVSADGTKVFVTGKLFWTEPQEPSSLVHQDTGTIAYNAATGAVLWATRTPDMWAVAIAVSPNGKQVFFTGERSNTGTLRDVGTFALDASSGHQLWAQRFDGPGHQDDSAFAITVTPDSSRVVVAGKTFSSQRKDENLTIEYWTSSGEQKWLTRYNVDPVTYWEFPRSVATSPDGGFVVVTGFTYNQFQQFTMDVVTEAYDTVTGALLWAARYGDPARQDDRAERVAFSPDGQKIFVTGFSGRGAATGQDYLTLAYDSFGNQLWASNYDGTAHSIDSAVALAVSHDGTKVVVTGTTIDAFFVGNDYTTVAYDASSGAQLWMSRKNRGDDRAVDLAMVPGGAEVVVTGTTRPNPNASSDFTTVMIAL
jgi:Tol biopolymer transport system component